MGDFKLNQLNPFAWIGAIYYKVNNWWQLRQYKKQGDKALKRINDELVKKNTKNN